VFTKPEILEALRLKGSNSTSDLKIFTPDALSRNPRAKAWYETGGKTHNDYFRNLKLSDFKTSLQRGKEGKERKKEEGSRSRRRRRSSSVEEGSSKRHRKSRDSSDSEDASTDEQPPEKKKSTAKRRAASEDLDS
jgi:hypothetical protein